MKKYKEFIKEGNIFGSSKSDRQNSVLDAIERGDMESVRRFLADPKNNDIFVSNIPVTRSLSKITDKDKFKEMLDLLSTRYNKDHIIRNIYNDAISHSDNETVKFIFDELDTDVNMNYGLPLRDAISSGNKELFDYFINKGTDKDIDDGTAIRTAIYNKKYDMAQELADKGYKFGEKDIKDFIPYQKYGGSTSGYYTKDGPVVEYEQEEKERSKDPIISNELLDYTVKNFPENLKHIADSLTEEQYEKYKDMIVASTDFDIFDDVS